jgi:hypothetical protein
MSDSNLSLVLEKSDQQTLRALVRDTLELCLKDDPSCAAIKHPLGFLRVPIIRTPSTGLYVHIWTQLIDLPRPSTSAIHAHNWHLLSRVIAGTVTNQVFNAQESDNGDYHLFEILHHSETVDELCSTGRLFRCINYSEDHYLAGDYYRLAANTFHTSTVTLLADTVTLVLSTDRTSAIEYALDKSVRGTHLVHRKPCTRQELYAAVPILIERLGE